MFGMICVAGEPSRLDETGIATDVHLGTGDAHIKRKIDDRSRDHDIGHGVAERGDDSHREDEQRKRHDGVGQPTDDPVRPAAVEAGGDAGEPAAGKDQRDRTDRNRHVETRGDDDAGEDIATQLIGAEPVTHRRRLQRSRGIARQRIVRNDRRTDDRGDHQNDEQAE
jgi:hypothetical protein